MVQSVFFLHLPPAHDFLFKIADIMEYRQIVAVTGLPGLFQLLNAQNNGAIVKNLTDKGVSFISSRKHQLTPLESIEIYTTDENVRLDEVFSKMIAFDAEAIAANEKNEKNHYRDLFRTVLPNFDEERVYASDIKKVFKWYQLLKENDLLHFESRNAEEKTEEAVVATAEEAVPAEEAPVKKARKTTKKKEAKPTEE